MDAVQSLLFGPFDRIDNVSAIWLNLSELLLMLESVI